MTRDLTDSGWRQTVSGKAFYLFDPSPEDFSLIDIAHGLALLCRFGGQVRQFFSVAQHSVLVMQCVQQRFGCTDKKTLRTALFHDAAESYIGDMIHPLKVKDDFFREVEARIERAMAGIFDLEYPMPPVIKKADNALLLAERNALMPKPPRPWTVREPPWPSHGILEFWGPTTAKGEFLLEAHALMPETTTVRQRLGLE